MSKAWDYDDDDDNDDECDDIIPTAVQAARSCPEVRQAGRREVNQGTSGGKGLKHVGIGGKGAGTVQCSVL